MNWFKQKSSEEIRDEQRIRLQKQRIQDAQQSEINRKPNPRQGKVFQEENFIEMIVLQHNQMIKLNTYRTQPQDPHKARAIVFMFHGLGSHMNHGGHLAEQLCNIGCIVVGFDHRGFGKSQGLRGYLENLQLHLQDSNLFIDNVLNLYAKQGINNLPIFLTGLSMGGMTSFKLSIQHPNRFRGIIMFAPAIKSPLSSAMTNTVSCLSFICPKTQLVAPKRGQATKNPQVSDDHYADQYVYLEGMRPITIKTILSAMQECSQNYHQLKTPWLVIQGGLDKLVDPELAYELERQSPIEDKTVLFYDDLWHDIWHEEEIDDIIPKMIHWVDKRI